MPTIEFIRRVYNNARSCFSHHYYYIFFSRIIIRFSPTTIVIIIQFIIIVRYRMSIGFTLAPKGSTLPPTPCTPLRTSVSVRRTATVRLARLRGGTPLKSTSVLPPRARRRPRLNSFVRVLRVVGRPSSSLLLLSSSSSSSSVSFRFSRVTDRRRSFFVRHANVFFLFDRVLHECL